MNSAHSNLINKIGNLTELFCLGYYLEALSANFLNLKSTGTTIMLHRQNPELLPVELSFSYN